MLFGVVGVAQVEFRRARAVHPLAEELVDVGMRGLFDGLGKIGGNNVFAAIHLEILLDAAVKSVFTDLVTKHVEDPAAFSVSVAVELTGIVEIVAHDRLVPEIAAFEPFARVVPALVIGLVLAEVRFAPYHFQKRCEAFVEPDDQVVFAGEIFGSELGVNEGVAGVGGGAGILHAAGDEVVHHDLRVFFPRVVDAKFFAKQLDHRRSASEVDGQAVRAALRSVIGDWDTAPGILHFLEFASNDGDQVSGAGDGLLPIPGFQSLAGVADADEFAVRNGDPGSRNGKDRFRREAIVRVVVGREVVMRVLRFALGPDLAGTVRIILVRQNEIHSLCRLAFVTDGDLELFSGLGPCREGNDQFLRRRFKLCGRLVDRHLLNGEPRGVENDFRGTVAKNRKRVRDLANNFFLVEVEAQGDLRMLQIIVAAACVRLIGRELRRGDENRQQRCERKKRRATAMVIGVAKRFADHSTLLL